MRTDLNTYSYNKIKQNSGLVHSITSILKGKFVCYSNMAQQSVAKVTEDEVYLKRMKTLPLSNNRFTYDIEQDNEHREMFY